MSILQEILTILVCQVSNEIMRILPTTTTLANTELLTETIFTGWMIITLYILETNEFLNFFFL